MFLNLYDVRIWEGELNARQTLLWHDVVDKLQPSKGKLITKETYDERRVT